MDDKVRPASEEVQQEGTGFGNEPGPGGCPVGPNRYPRPSVPLKFDFHFPDEVWTIILELLSPEDCYAACQAYPMFDRLLHKSKPLWMFGKVIPHLYEGNYLGRNALLALRQGCSGWKTELDALIAKETMETMETLETLDDEALHFPQKLFRFSSMATVDIFNGLFSDSPYGGSNPFISRFVSIQCLSAPAFQSSIIAILEKFGEHIWSLELLGGRPANDDYLFLKQILSALPNLRTMTVHRLADSVSQATMAQHPLPPLPSLTQLILYNAVVFGNDHQDEDVDEQEEEEEDDDEEDNEDEEEGVEGEGRHEDEHRPSFLSAFVSPYATQLHSLNISFGNVGLVADRIFRNAFPQLSSLVMHNVQNDNELACLFSLNAPLLGKLVLSGPLDGHSDAPNVTVDGLLRVVGQLDSVEDLLITGLVDTTGPVAQLGNNNSTIKQLLLNFSNDDEDDEEPFIVPSFDFLRHFSALEELRIQLNSWGHYVGREEGDDEVQIYRMVSNGGSVYNSNIWNILPNLKLVELTCVETEEVLYGTRNGFVFSQQFAEALRNFRMNNPQV